MNNFQNMKAGDFILYYFLEQFHYFEITFQH